MDIFDNTAARDSLIPNPRFGQECLLKDTGNFQLYYGTTIGWQAPWQTAWGEVGRAELASFYTFQTPSALEPTPMGTVDFTPLPGRKYDVRWRVTAETNDKGQSFDVGMALITTIGGSGAQTSFATLGGNFILDGIVFPATDIKSVYVLNWRRVFEVTREVTTLISPGTDATIVGQFAYGSALVANLFTSTTDGLYGKDDPGSESSMIVRDIGPSANLSTVS